MWRMAPQWSCVEYTCASALMCVGVYLNYCVCVCVCAQGELPGGECVCQWQLLISSLPASVCVWICLNGEAQCRAVPWYQLSTQLYHHSGLTGPEPGPAQEPSLPRSALSSFLKRRRHWGDCCCSPSLTLPLALSFSISLSLSHTHTHTHPRPANPSPLPGPPCGVCPSKFLSLKLWLCDCCISQIKMCWNNAARSRAQKHAPSFLSWVHGLHCLEEALPETLTFYTLILADGTRFLLYKMLLLR